MESNDIKNVNNEPSWHNKMNYQLFRFRVTQGTSFSIVAHLSIMFRSPNLINLSYPKSVPSYYLSLCQP